MMMMMTTDAGRNKLHCSLPKSTRCGCRGAFFMILTPHVCFDSPCATQLTMFVNAEPDALEARYDGLNLMGVLNAECTCLVALAVLLECILRICVFSNEELSTQIQLST